MQVCAIIATAPSSTNSAPSHHPSVTHVNGAATSPNASAPTVCVVTRTVSDVPATRRVNTIKTENDRLPAIATIAGGVSEPAVGDSAIITPMNPAITASQRRQPTCSPSNNGDTAVT